MISFTKINTKKTLFFKGFLVLFGFVVFSGAHGVAIEPNSLLKEGAKIEYPGLLLEKYYQILRQKAYQESYDIRSAEALSKAKSYSQWSNGTRWLPRLDLQLAQAINKDAAPSNGIMSALSHMPGVKFDDSSYNTSRWVLSLNFPLFSRGVQLANVLACHEKTQAEVALDIEKAKFDSKLKQLFMGFLIQSYKVASLEESLKAAQSSVSDAEVRLGLGQRTKLDLLRAKANFSNIEARILSAKLSQDQSLQTLAEATKVLASELLTPEFHTLLINESGFSIEFENWLDLAHDFDQMKQTEILLSDLVQFEQKVAGSLQFQKIIRDFEVQKTQAKNLSASEWPRLELGANYSKSALDWSEALKSGGTSYGASASVTLPLFSFGSFWSSTKESSLMSEVAEINKDRALSLLRDQMRTLLGQIQTLRQTYQSQKIMLEQAIEIQKLSQKSYQLGKLSTVDMLNAQNELVEARINLTLTSTQLKGAWLEIKWMLNL